MNVGWLHAFEGNPQLAHARLCPISAITSAKADFCAPVGGTL